MTREHFDKAKQLFKRQEWLKKQIANLTALGGTFSSAELVFPEANKDWNRVEVDSDYVDEVRFCLMRLYAKELDNVEKALERM